MFNTNKFFQFVTFKWFLDPYVKHRILWSQHSTILGEWKQGDLVIVLTVCRPSVVCLHDNSKSINRFVTKLFLELVVCPKSSSKMSKMGRTKSYFHSQTDGKHCLEPPGVRIWWWKLFSDLRWRWQRKGTKE